MADWKFYGRKEQLSELERIFSRKRWLLAKVTGRRRIGNRHGLIPQDLNDLTHGLS